MEQEVSVTVDTARIELERAEYEVEMEGNEVDKEVYFEQVQAICGTYYCTL